MKFDFLQELIHGTNAADKRVVSVCFSPDGDMVLSGSKDESLKGWNTKTGSCLFTIKAHQNTLFRVNHHPTENCFISCAGDGKVCVWEYNPVWQK